MRRVLAALLLVGCGGSDGGGAMDETGGATDSAGSDGGESGTDSDGPDDPVGDLDPGRVTLHRLNRVEYNNTMRDLFFGMDLRPADSFPADEVALGYDNIADVLSVTPLLLEMYEGAADLVLEEAMGRDEIRDAIVTCDVGDEDCPAQILRAFATRAWRRPVTDEEVARLAAHVGTVTGAGGTRLEGVVAGLKHALLSVHFLFRVELDETDEAHPLTDYELASRLSYFMWSSMPDDELFALADAGELQDAEVIDEQVGRMLADPKAIALLDNFAGQWLRLRSIAGLDKSAEAYPDFDDELREAMVGEADALVIDLFTGSRSMMDILVGDETVMNDRLAQHYGLPNVGGDELVPVSLEGVPRRGLMTQAGMMAVLSHSDRTSPTKRGTWILTHLLCDPPPPPPPDVDDDLGDPPTTGTVRDQLEEHRENPNCAVCHAVMDPVGLAFENYDGVGAWRDQENGEMIDVSGELVDGRTFDNAIDLLEMYAEEGTQFRRCAARQVLTYALGRAVDGGDDETFVDELADALASSEDRLPPLLAAVARSGAFRARRAE